MRYWNDRQLFGFASWLGQESADSKEACMDSCLSKSKCDAILYSADQKMCILYVEPTSTTTLEVATGYFTAIKCHLSLNPSPADGKYPAPGKTQFILGL